MTALDLEPIVARAELAARKRARYTAGSNSRRMTAEESADDVLALVAEVERLRKALVELIEVAQFYLNENRATAAMHEQMHAAGLLPVEQSWSTWRELLLARRGRSAEILEEFRVATVSDSLEVYATFATALGIPGLVRAESPQDREAAVAAWLRSHASTLRHTTTGGTE